MQPEAAVDALGLVGVTIATCGSTRASTPAGSASSTAALHEGSASRSRSSASASRRSRRRTRRSARRSAGRFRETKLLYRLSQGNLDIVRCLRRGARHRERGVPYMVLEWLDGCTLEPSSRSGGAALARARSTARSAARQRRSGARVCARARRRPSRREAGNLFLTRTHGGRDEGPRLRAREDPLRRVDRRTAELSTTVGVHFCSPSYGAPEQFSVESARSVRGPTCTRSRSCSSRS